MNDEVGKLSFEELLSRLTDEGLDESEFAELGSFIESDSELRRRYLEYCQIHGLLRSEHGLLASWGVPELEVNQAASPANRWRSWRNPAITMWLVAAALMAVMAIPIWRLASDDATPTAAITPPYRGTPVARLTKQVRANFAYGPKGETAAAAGQVMPQGTYELKTGIVELQSNSGAVMTIEGPSVFTLADDQCVRVESGRIAVHVPKQAVGFRVEIANATVVDLGTDFAVEAVSGKNSEVHVFDGKVQVNLHGSKTSSATPLRLATGEATRIDFLTGLPSGIDLDKQRFLRRLENESRRYSDRVLELRPAAYYPMEPVSDGTSLRDVGPSRADAKINFGRATEPVWAPGKIGVAFALGGPDQETYATADSYPQAEGNQVSVVAWVTASSRPRWASIAKNWAGADDRGQFHFGLHFDSGELEAHIEDSSGKEIVVKDSTPLPLHTWHHVSFVADGQTLRLYRNGQQVDAAPYHKLHRDERIKALAIGTKLNLQGDAPDHQDFNMWDGRLDELAIFNHALSEEQIRELYELGNKSGLD
jgi:hypothetical protein